MLDRTHNAIIAFFLATFISFIPSLALANDNGVAGTLHSLRSEHGKICMAGHFHYSAGKAKTKRQALKSAARAWSTFVYYEYGTDWAVFRYAASKRKKCTKEDHRLWKCKISARPCKKR